MILSRTGIIPPKEWHHDPKIHNDNIYTVAINLIENNIEVPEEWRYEPEYRIRYFYLHENKCIEKCVYHGTTAMKLARDKIIPPKYFEHDPNIKNGDNETVCDIL